MSSDAANSHTVDDCRCHHRYPNGSRCRLPAPGAELRSCNRHAALAQNRSEAADLAAATLTAGITEFRCADDVNEFLSRLLLAFAQDRISPRRAAVLAYITSQLLRGLAAAAREVHQAESEAKRKPPVIICTNPGPKREQENQI
jgi:hypothetical protein